MKIQMIDMMTKMPLINTKIQIQVKGKDSGFITLMSDGTGCVMLDRKYQGQQIMCPAGGCQGPWITAEDGVIITVNTKHKSTETSHSSK